MLPEGLCAGLSFSGTRARGYFWGSDVPGVKAANQPEHGRSSPVYDLFKMGVCIRAYKVCTH